MKKLLIVALLLMSFSAFAEETLGDKAQTAGDSAARGTKQTVRKAKKKYRDNTGQRNRVQDAKDSTKNAGEDISDKAKELKRKAD